MSRRTKKVGPAGRFGARYGVKIRNRFIQTERKKNTIYRCPQCNYLAVKRKASGIWECRHCGYTFAGGAYTPTTQIVGKIFTTSSMEDKYSALKERIKEANISQSEEE